jgi:hypothetical protein
LTRLRHRLCIATNGLPACAHQHYAGNHGRHEESASIFEPAFRLRDMRSELARPLIAVTVRFSVSAALATDRPFSKRVRRRLSSSGVQIFRCSPFISFSLSVLGLGELNGLFESLSFSTHNVKLRSNQRVLRSKNIEYCFSRGRPPGLNLPIHSVLPRLDALVSKHEAKAHAISPVIQKGN